MIMSEDWKVSTSDSCTLCMGLLQHLEMPVFSASLLLKSGLFTCILEKFFRGAPPPYPPARGSAPGPRRGLRPRTPARTRRFAPSSQLARFARNLTPPIEKSWLRPCAERKFSKEFLVFRILLIRRTFLLLELWQNRELPCIYLVLWLRLTCNNSW